MLIAFAILGTFIATFVYAQVGLTYLVLVVLSKIFLILAAFGIGLLIYLTYRGIQWYRYRNYIPKETEQ